MFCSIWEFAQLHDHFFLVQQSNTIRLWKVSSIISLPCPFMPKLALKQLSQRLKPSQHGPACGMSYFTLKVSEVFYICNDPFIVIEWIQIRLMDFQMLSVGRYLAHLSPIVSINKFQISISVDLRTRFLRAQMYSKFRKALCNGLCMGGTASRNCRYISTWVCIHIGVSICMHLYIIYVYIFVPCYV